MFKNFEKIEDKFRKNCVNMAEAWAILEKTNKIFRSKIDNFGASLENLQSNFEKFYTKFKENLSNKLKFLNKICRIIQYIFYLGTVSYCSAYHRKPLELILQFVKTGL